jgi:hypothetical protein
MSYQLEKLSDEAIFVQTLNSDFNPAEETTTFIEATLRALELLEERVTAILNMRAMTLTFEAVIFNSNMQAYRNVLYHRNVRKTFFVPPQNTLVLFTKGPSLLLLQNKQIRLFYTLEETLAHVREQAES